MDLFSSAGRTFLRKLKRQPFGAGWVFRQFKCMEFQIEDDLAALPDFYLNSGCRPIQVESAASTADSQPEDDAGAK
jgi:hypothetical protein